MDRDENQQLPTVPLGNLQAIGHQPRVTLLVNHQSGVEAVALGRDQSLVIGRAPPADVPIPDESLSRQHARFEWKGDQLSVQDLGSTNGTTVNGQRVEEAEIQVGDEVGLGRVIVSIHERTSPVAGVEGTERLRVRLEEEVTRARYFKRGLSLLLLESSKPQEVPLHQWCPVVQKQARPVDRVALHDSGLVAVILPETDHEKALKLVSDIKGGVSELSVLRGGIASFPDDGGTASKLIELARTALARADATHPVRSAAAMDPGQWVQTQQQAPVEMEVDGAVIRSPAMEKLYGIVDRLAKSMIPALILGETGTGKELVARAIHERGPRGKGPMRSINCAAIPDQLIESALFGHEKGAFTGATQRTKGVFEEADGGTVFLDEVGELSPSAQAALLRVLETKRICRVGSSRELAVDVRVVAATHCDLEEMCEAGTFRWDLLYRLNTMILSIPPLRERPEEVEPLARFFLEQALAENDAPARQISDEALAALKAHHWPGNVRELRNEIERALVVAIGTAILVEDLSDKVQRCWQETPRAPGPEPGEQVEFKTLVQRYESQVLRDALERTGWNQSAVSRELGIPMRTLTNKIQAYGLKRPG